MLFSLTIGMQENHDKNTKVNNRLAIRAVIIRNGRILMVQTGKGDYKFPGGGLKDGENHEDTLIREVREETGYSISRIIEKVGMVIERSMDGFEKGSIFEMISHYYLCEVSENYGPQELDDYEKEWGFRPQWVTIDHAICENETALKRKSCFRWVQRETSVLHQLKGVLIT